MDPETLPPDTTLRTRKDRLAYGRGLDELAGAWELIHRLTRRNFLRATSAAAATAAIAGAGGAALLTPRPARADEAVKTGKFVFPRLQFSVTDNTPDQWDVGPIGDVNLRKKLQELTNINVSLEPKVVRLGDFDEMCRYPFVFMTSEGFFNLPEKEEKNMKEFLERGGFIQADDCVFGGREDRFFRTYVKLINKLFEKNDSSPANQMRPIPKDHEIYHIYFDFKDGSPHMQGVRSHDGHDGAWGLFEPGTGRLMTYCDPGDLHCGWMCKYWGMGKNIEAIKMGVNVIIYFLTH